MRRHVTVCPQFLRKTYTLGVKEIEELKSSPLEPTIRFTRRTLLLTTVSLIAKKLNSPEASPISRSVATYSRKMEPSWRMVFLEKDTFGTEIKSPPSTEISNQADWIPFMDAESKKNLAG